MKRLAWFGVFLVAGCAALKEPVKDPVTGEPDPSGKVVYDVLVESAATTAGVVGANPLWVTLVGAAGALARDKVVGKKKTA
jgi:hypothetical protein